MIDKKYQESFWKKIIKSDSCWKWTAAKKDGYGVLGIGQKRIEKAHRISWQIHFGEIPKGMFICHRCDNPECCNPEHLFFGTAKDNTDDMIRKGRGSKPPPMAGHNRILFPQWIINLLGKEPDCKVAERYGCTKSPISRVRRQLGIKSFSQSTGHDGRFKSGNPHPRWHKIGG